VSLLERITRLEEWRNVIDRLIEDTQESNKWLVRGIVITVLAAVIAAVKLS